MTTKVPEQFDLTQYLGLWSIEAERGQQMFRAIKQYDWQSHAAEFQIKLAAGEADGQYRPYVVRDGVAILNLTGTMTKYGSSLSSGGSTVRLRQLFRQAGRDETVGAILLNIDSPGGTVAGTQDLAAEVAKVNAKKPVFAFVEDLAASAAYWVAAQASEIHANNPTALIGSIGTFFGVYDLSGMAGQEGIKAIVLKTGKYKGAGFPGAEITSDQVAYWQSIVDKTQVEFSAGIAAGRKMTSAEVEAVADGRAWLAGDAKANKLIDAVSTFEDVFEKAARMASASMKKGKRQMSAEKDREAPQAATLAELKTALPKSSAEFRERMLERNATLVDARAAWLDDREASLDARETKIGEREAAVAEKEKAAEEKAKASGVKTVKDPDQKSTTGEGKGVATDQYWAAVKARVEEAKCTKAQAIAFVAANDPDLHKRFIEETNKNRG